MRCRSMASLVLALIALTVFVRAEDERPKPWWDQAVAEAVRVARKFVALSVPSHPDDNPEHIHLFDGGDLENLFELAGVQRVSIDHVLNHLIALAVLERP